MAKRETFVTNLKASRCMIACASIVLFTIVLFLNRFFVYDFIWLHGELSQDESEFVNRWTFEGEYYPQVHSYGLRNKAIVLFVSLDPDVHGRELETSLLWLVNDIKKSKLRCLILAIGAARFSDEHLVHLSGIENIKEIYFEMPNEVSVAGIEKFERLNPKTKLFSKSRPNEFLPWTRVDE